MAEKPGFLRGAKGAPMGPGAAGEAPGGKSPSGSRGYPGASGAQTAGEAIGASKALPGAAPVKLGETTYGDTAALGAEQTNPNYGAGKAG